MLNTTVVVSSIEPSSVGTVLVYFDVLLSQTSDYAVLDSFGNVQDLFCPGEDYFALEAGTPACLWVLDSFRSIIPVAGVYCNDQYMPSQWAPETITAPFVSHNEVFLDVPFDEYARQEQFYGAAFATAVQSALGITGLPNILVRGRRSGGSREGPSVRQLVALVRKHTGRDLNRSNYSKERLIARLPAEVRRALGGDVPDWTGASEEKTTSSPNETDSGLPNLADVADAAFAAQELEKGVAPEYTPGTETLPTGTPLLLPRLGASAAAPLVFGGPNVAHAFADLAVHGSGVTTVEKQRQFELRMIQLELERDEARIQARFEASVKAARLGL